MSVLLFQTKSGSWLGFPLIVGFFAAFVAYRWGMDRYRSGQPKTLVPSLGLRFEGNDWLDGRGMPPSELGLYSRGDANGWTRNVMTTTRANLSVSIFDYIYISGSGRNSRRVVQTAAAFKKSGVSLPLFDIWAVPSGRVLRELTAEADPGSLAGRKYELNGVAHDELTVFPPDLISALENLDPEGLWQMQGARDTLLLYHPERKIAVKNLRSFLDETCSIAGQFFTKISAQGDKVSGTS
jgi:hypothetical protein